MLPCARRTWGSRPLCHIPRARTFWGRIGPPTAAAAIPKLKPRRSEPVVRRGVHPATRADQPEARDGSTTPRPCPENRLGSPPPWRRRQLEPRARPARGRPACGRRLAAVCQQRLNTDDDHLRKHTVDRPEPQADAAVAAGSNAHNPTTLQQRPGTGDEALSAEPCL